MVKGCERRLVIYKSTNSKYFSEIHFIMKEEIDTKNEKRNDIIAEANKIVEESMIKSEKLNKKARKRLSFLLFFLLGFGFSSLISVILAHFNLI